MSAFSHLPQNPSFSWNGMEIPKLLSVTLLGHQKTPHPKASHEHEPLGSLKGTMCLFVGLEPRALCLRGFWSSLPGLQPRGSSGRDDCPPSPVFCCAPATTSAPSLQTPGKAPATLAVLLKSQERDRAPQCPLACYANSVPSVVPGCTYRFGSLINCVFWK